MTDSTQFLLKDRVTSYLQKLQDAISTSLETLDGGATFREDVWERPGGGGGRSKILCDGKIFEKAGVNYSEVYGSSPEYLTREQPTAKEFFATGVSLVLHPHSPKIPTIHANFRYFELSDGKAWFGGGIDLTPFYLDESDVILFHTKLKATCDLHNLNYFPKFKQWADDYFLIKHRGERRGVGGIFFDQLGADSNYLEPEFSFLQNIGNTFLPAYTPIVEKHRSDSYTEDEKRWQLLRRGRYVEFNLVYDKGTVFGLETGGRIESILMSLPTLARWEYDNHPIPGSPEEVLLNVLVTPRDWTL